MKRPDTWHKRLLALAMAFVLLCAALAGCKSSLPSSSSAASAAAGGQSGAGSSAPADSGEDPAAGDAAAGAGPEGEGDTGANAGADGEGGTGATPTASLYAPEAEPAAEAACLLNLETGLFVYEKNADTPLPAASMVKLMTCMLVAERVPEAEWDTTLVTASKLWVYDELYGKNASTADIRRGETLSVRELLNAALLPSANEAALILADYACRGYMPNFYYMMNTRARSLGCTGTNFVDANGLSEQSVTTARDMARIMQAFLKFPGLVEILGKTSFEIAAHEAHEAPYQVHTTNRLLVQSSPYGGLMGGYASAMIGGKTGSFGEWQNFASAASHGGATYVCVVMHSPNAADTVGAGLDPAQARPALVESAALYTWAFSSLEVRPVLDAAQPATELRVRYATDTGSVRLMPESDLKAVLPLGAADTEVQRRYDLPDSLAAPVKAGQVVGSVTLVLGGQVLGSTRLTAECAVARNETLYWLQRAGEVLTGTFFRVLLVVVLVMVGLYAGLLAWLNSQRKKQRQGGVPRRPQGRN